MKRTAVYARISRGDEDAPDLQVRDARAEAARLGWSVVEEFVITEVESGRVSREGPARLIAGAKSRPRPFDVVMVRALDRVARDAGLMRDMLEALSVRGVEVYEYQNHRVVPFDKPIDEFMVDAQGFQAKQYARSVGDNARDTLVDRVKVSEAKPLSNWTGQKEFGFRYERHCSCPGSKCTSKACYTARLINDETADVPREIFTLADTGHGDLKIAQTLTAKYGDRFGAWSKDRVRGILTNTIYDGRVLYGRTKTVTLKVVEGETIVRKGRTLAVGEKYDLRVPAPKDDWQYGVAPRIVDHDLWERVQAHRRKIAAQYARTEDGRLLTKPEDRTKNLSTPPAFISGVLRCEECGGSKVPRGKNSTSPRFFCPRRSNGSGCTNGHGESVKMLDAAVRSALMMRLDEENLWPEMLALAESNRTAEVEAAPARESDLVGVATLEKEIKNLTDLAARGRQGDSAAFND